MFHKFFEKNMPHLYELVLGDIQIDSDEPTDYFSMRKEMIVKVFLHIATWILVVFGFINFFVYKQTALGVVDLFAAMVSFYTVFILKNKRNLRIAIIVSSVNLFLFFLLYIYMNRNVDYGLIWSIFLPIFIIPLNGHKYGLRISLLFYAFAFLIAYLGIGVWDDSQWNTHSFIRFVVSSLVLVFVIYITELAIYRSNVLLFEKERKEREYVKKLQDSAEKDYLTQIYNRRKIIEIISEEIQRAHRYNLHLSLAIVDIDFFKKINDTYGHNCGDEVLVEFVEVISSHLRESDYVGRWGGEEFVILFTHTTLEDALKKSERLCCEIREQDFTNVGHLTCSIGIAALTPEIVSLEGLVDKADKALYQAKEMGRDRAIEYRV